jgi:hypothetical protein
MTPKLFPLTVLVPETWTDWRGMSWLPISPQNGVVFHPTDDPVPADILVRRYRGDLWVLSRKGERLILTVTPLDEMTPFTAFSAFRTFNQNASATTPVTVCADSEYFYNVATDSGSALLLHIAHRTLGQWTRYRLPDYIGTQVSLIALAESRLLLTYTQPSKQGFILRTWYDEVGLRVPDVINWPPPGRLVCRISQDGGTTWPEVASPIQSTAVLSTRTTCDEKGRLWLIVNASENIIEQTTRLWLTMSETQGRSWHAPLALTDGKALDRMPTIAAWKGCIYVAYTHRNAGKSQLYLHTIAPDKVWAPSNKR